MTSMATRAAMKFCAPRSEEHTSELQSQSNLVCRLLLEKKKLRKRRRAQCRSQDRQRHRAPSRAQCERGRAPAGRWRASFFFNDTATTEIYTLSLHDALPI